MKNCVSCQKELPDTAMHCVFCGAKQPAPQAGGAAGGGDVKKTVMGYSAAELLKNVDKSKQGGSAPPPQASPPQASPPPSQPPHQGGGGAPSPMGPPPGAPPQGGPPPGAPPQQQSPGAAKTMMADQLGPPPSGAGGAPGMGPPPGGPPGGPPPGGQQQNPGAAKTMMADQLGPPPGGAGGAPGMGPPPGHGAPNPMGPPPGAAATPMGPPPGGAPPHPGMGHPPGHPAPGGVPQGPMAGRPETEQVKPLSPPPYLASQTAARMDAPQDPWEGSLRMVMLVFGILLVAAFAAPHALGEKAQFLWSNFGDQPGKMKVFALMVGGTGLLAIVLGALPLPSAGRGIGAAVLGLSPILYSEIVGRSGGHELDPFQLIRVAGMLALVAGLIVRSQYKGSMASRIMVTVGGLAVIAFYLIPQEAYGDKMALMAMIDGLADMEGKAKVIPILGLVPLVLAVASIIFTWIPAPNGGGAIVWAWCWIVLPFALAIVPFFLAEGPIGERLKMGLGQVIWAPATMAAWIALTGYGGATVVGKQLEHS